MSDLVELKDPNQRTYGYEIRRRIIKKFYGEAGQLVGLVFPTRSITLFKTDEPYRAGTAFGEKTFEERWFEAWSTS